MERVIDRAAYRRNNTETTKIDNTEDVEISNERNIFEVPGSDERLVINQTDPYGIPNVYLAQNTHDNEGSVAQRLQDRYDGTDRTDVEIRQLFNTNKGIYQSEKMYEVAEYHKEEDCKDLSFEEVDGNLNTGHQHTISVDSTIIYQGREMPVSEVAELPRFKLSCVF